MHLEFHCRHVEGSTQLVVLATAGFALSIGQQAGDAVLAGALPPQRGRLEFPLPGLLFGDNHLDPLKCRLLADALTHCNLSQP